MALLIRSYGSPAHVRRISSVPRSVYNGLALQVTQRLTHGFQFIASYTYSRAKDDRPDQTIVVVGADDAKIVENQLSAGADYGRSDTDIPHRFVFSPVYEWGRIHWTENPVAQALFSDQSRPSFSSSPARLIPRW